MGRFLRRALLLGGCVILLTGSECYLGLESSDYFRGLTDGEAGYHDPPPEKITGRSGAYYRGYIIGYRHARMVDQRGDPDAAVQDEQ